MIFEKDCGNLSILNYTSGICENCSLSDCEQCESMNICNKCSIGFSL